MGGRGSNSGLASSGSMTPQPQINPAPQAMPAPAAAVQNAPPSTAPQAMGGGSLLSVGPISYTPLNQKDEADLGKVWNGYDINTKLAINQYIRQDQTNTGYGVGQNLNHKLENGQALNANEQYMVNMMDAAMHPLGKNTTLIRAAHQDFLEALGVKNYQRMTDAQLNAAVQGVEYTEKKFVSTAYDAKKNPFIGGSQSGGREVFINISTPASTNCIMGNLKQAEIILSRDTKYRVKGAHFDGTFAKSARWWYTAARNRGCRDLRVRRLEMASKQKKSTESGSRFMATGKSVTIIKKPAKKASAKKGGK